MEAITAWIRPSSTAKDNPLNPWLYAGLASTFPNIEPSSTDAGKTRLCRPQKDPWDPPSADDDLPQPCKIFQTTSPEEQPPPTLEELTLENATASSLLIFKYRNKMHAIPQACPHQGYPMTRASISDIEDFGIVLSAGITCPKHGWTFDLHTGEADTGRYKLGIWEVETRGEGEGEEVWVRRKERRRIG